MFFSIVPNNKSFLKNIDTGKKHHLKTYLKKMIEYTSKVYDALLRTEHLKSQSCRAGRKVRARQHSGVCNTLFSRKYKVSQRITKIR